LRAGWDGPSAVQELNSLLPNHTSPTQVKMTLSSLGNLPACIYKLKGLINWAEGDRIEIGGGKIRAKGMACFWKTSDSRRTRFPAFF
jgi:hypothetical protein